MWWPLLGGLVVGIGGLIEPQALGVGYDNIAGMLQGHMLPPAGAAAARGQGDHLVGGARLGHLGRRAGAAADHGRRDGHRARRASCRTAAPGFWALLAMAATMGGTMRSPLTATFFAVELTGNTHVLLPLIAACGTAHAVTVLLMRRSILTEKVARRGHHLVREYRVDPFALTRVREVMTTAVETVPATMTLHGAAAFLTNPATTHPSFPVVDAEQAGARRRRSAGGAALAAGRHAPQDDARRTARRGQDRRRPPGRISRKPGRPPVPANVAHLPVISREDRRLVGYIGWKDLMRVRSSWPEEQQRTSFFRTRPASAD